MTRLSEALSLKFLTEHQTAFCDRLADIRSSGLLPSAAPDIFSFCRYVSQGLRPLIPVQDSAFIARFILERFEEVVLMLNPDLPGELHNLQDHQLSAMEEDLGKVLDRACDGLRGKWIDALVGPSSDLQFRPAPNPRSRSGRSAGGSQKIPPMNRGTARNPSSLPSDLSEHTAKVDISPEKPQRRQNRVKDFDPRGAASANGHVLMPEPTSRERPIVAEVPPENTVNSPHLPDASSQVGDTGFHELAGPSLSPCHLAVEPSVPSQQPLTRPEIARFSERFLSAFREFLGSRNVARKCAEAQQMLVSEADNLPHTSERFIDWARENGGGVRAIGDVADQMAAALIRHKWSMTPSEVTRFCISLQMFAERCRNAAREDHSHTAERRFGIQLAACGAVVVPDVFIEK